MGQNDDGITDQERIDVYETVFEKFAKGKPSLTLPRLILVGAQPGAGKSRVAERAKRELASLGSPVMADIDDIRPDYPRVKETFDAHPFKMSAITNKECWGWTSHLLLDARHAKNNIVYQATIRNANRVEDLIKDFQKDGFAVDLFAVATNSKQSVYGIFNRFEIDVSNLLAGFEVIPRWVPIPFHNQVYRAFPRNLDYLAENARLERVGVFARNGADLYFSDDQLIHRGAGEALLKEQNRLWSVDERNGFAHSWKMLMDQIKERPEGNLKPKWYVRTAELYAKEADYYARSQAFSADPAPSGVLIVCRTPNHHFAESENGLLVGYGKEDKRAVSRPVVKPADPKP